MASGRDKHLDNVERILIEIADAIVAPRSMRREALDDLAWFRRARKEAEAAKPLMDACRSMLESFEVLDEQSIEHFRNPDLQGVIRGAFLDAPHKARAAMARAVLADNAFRRTIADKP